MPLSRILGTLTSWNPLGPSGPVTGLLYLYLKIYFFSAEILKHYVRLAIFFSVSGHENPRLPFNIKPMADRTYHDVVVVDVVIYTCDHDPRRERRL